MDEWVYTIDVVQETLQYTWGSLCRWQGESLCQIKIHSVLWENQTTESIIYNYISFTIYTTLHRNIIYITIYITL